MKKISAERFKVHCLKLMDEVHVTRQPVLITKKGRPIAKLVPVQGRPKDVFGCMRGEVEIVGNILDPVVHPEDWELLR
jgi:prevent-host-death family protein